jgi:hypothetical protein
MKRLIVIVIMCSFVHFGTAFAAPVQWPVNGHWYEVLTPGGPSPGIITTITWSDAEASARSRGGDTWRR